MLGLPPSEEGGSGAGCSPAAVQVPGDGQPGPRRRVWRSGRAMPSAPRGRPGPVPGFASGSDRGFGFILARPPDPPLRGRVSPAGLSPRRAGGGHACPFSPWDARPREVPPCWLSHWRSRRDGHVPVGAEGGSGLPRVRGGRLPPRWGRGGAVIPVWVLG